jgi:hypothetical protein
MRVTWADNESQAASSLNGKAIAIAFDNIKQQLGIGQHG